MLGLNYSTLSLKLPLVNDSQNCKIRVSAESNAEMWSPSTSVTWFLSRVSVVPNYSVLIQGENGSLWFIAP